MLLTATEIHDLEINRAYWQNLAERYREVVIRVAAIELPCTAMIDELVELACYVLDQPPRTWLPSGDYNRRKADAINSQRQDG